MSVKLIALDMDGTLLNSEHHVSPASVSALKKAAESGILLAFATGRSLCELDEIRHAVAGMDYAILEGGASVRDLKSDRSVMAGTMPTADALEIYRMVLPFDPMFEALADDRVYTQKSCLENISHFDTCTFEEFVLQTRTPVDDIVRFLSARVQPISKLHMFFPDILARDRALEATAHLPFDITHQLRSNLEFTSRGVTKGLGVIRLAEYLNIPLSEVMAIGDNMNDVPMLEKVGYSVAMKNAVGPEVFAAAKYVTDTNDEDGVAKAILKLAV